MADVTSSGTATVTLPTDEQILITREFDAPRELVYRAWTTPELVMRWWSGHQATMKTADIDFRVGGAWRFVIVADREIAFHGEYREIVPNERIVNTEVFEDPSAEGEESLITVELAEHDGRTTLTMLCEYSSREVRDAVIDSGMMTGMQEQMDLLEEVARSLR